MPKRERHIVKRITLKNLETSQATIAILWRHLYRHGWQRVFELEAAIGGGGRTNAHLLRLLKAGFVERSGGAKNYAYRAVQGKDEMKPNPASTVNEIRARLSEMHQMTRKAIQTGLSVHAFEALRYLEKELDEIRGLMFVKHVGNLKKKGADAEK